MPSFQQFRSSKVQLPFGCTHQSANILKSASNYSSSLSLFANLNQIKLYVVRSSFRTKFSLAWTSSSSSSSFSSSHTSDDGRLDTVPQKRERGVPCENYAQLKKGSPCPLPNFRRGGGTKLGTESNFDNNIRT